MTELQLARMNLVYARRFGLIDWFQFFEMWRALPLTEEAYATQSKSKVKAA